MITEISDVIIRLGLAAVVGALIGINRDLTRKPMGSRTLALVALGAATVAIAAVRAPGIGEDADALSRVIQGIVQGVMGGISFIGAGVILRNPAARSVDGLTTAAAVWATAALGIACALGEWILVMVGTFVALVILAIPSVAVRSGLSPDDRDATDD